MVFAPEYSPESQQQLVSGYSSLLEPQVQKSQRRLAQTLAGTPGMWGSPRLSGMGEIESARLGQIGQYAQGLAQQTPQMQREERLTAEQRAYEDPYRQAQLMGQYNGQNTLAGQQFGEQQRQFNVGQGNWGQQFGEGQRQFNTGLGEQQRQFNVGQGNWGQQFGEGQRQFDVGQGNWGKQFGLSQQQQAMQQKQLEDTMATSQLQRQWYPSQFTGYGPGNQATMARQQWETGQTGQMPGGTNTMARDAMIASLTGQYGGSPTTQYLGQMMPYMTGGYLSPDTMGQGWAKKTGFQTEQQLQQQTPEWQTSVGMGFQNPYQMALEGQVDPDTLKKRYLDWINKQQA